MQAGLVFRSSMSGPRVVVIGGGISGLATAFFLRSQGAEVTLLESSERLGGKVLTGSFMGQPLDFGADAMLVRTGWVRDICDQLGVSELLVAPAARQAGAFSRGSLRTLPLGPQLGVARGVGALLASRILTPVQVARATAGTLRKHRVPASDTTVARVADSIFGAPYRRAIVDPLLAGVYAGNTEDMSYLATLPGWHTEISATGRLRFRGATSDESPFVSFGDGLGVLVDRLSSALDDIRLGHGVVKVRPGDPSSVLTPSGSIDADAVVLAIPAFAAADLIEDVPLAAETLKAIRYASVAVAVLGYDPPGPSLPDLSGFLVPPSEGEMLLTACSYSSKKWAHVGVEGKVILRCSAGRIEDHRAFEMSDEDLVAALLKDLRATAGITAQPSDVHVQRWPMSLPQYAVGHPERVRELRSLLEPQGVFPVGAAYDGVGIAACIGQAKSAADRVMSRLSRSTGPV